MSQLGTILPPVSSPGTSRRGFASMDPALQKQIAAKGGRSAHAQGKAHRWTPEQAREAGKKGGTNVSRDPAYMSEIGKRGGAARRAAATTGKVIDALAPAEEDRDVQ